MTDTPAGAFTDLPPLRRNRERLGNGGGTLRLVWILCAMFVAAQFLVPLIARVALNGGRVFPADEEGSLWGSVVADRVLAVPAWLTIATVAVGAIAAVWYLVTGAAAAKDAAYVGLLSLLFFGGFPWAIATLDEDPSGVLHAPGDDGFPMGWHWIVSPLGILVLVVAIVVSAVHRQKKGHGA